MMPCPSHPRFLHKTLAATFACLCVLSATAQSTDAVYSLHGTVVNGITNEPIARALVQSADRRLATMSDSEGHFAIEIHVPVAPSSNSNQLDNFSHFNGRRFGQRLFLVAARPGYLAPEQPTTLPLDDTLSGTDVQLKLMPGAIITGRVSATGTDDAANVRLLLLIHGTDGEGNRTWTQAGFHQTGGRGEFRFTGLRPGEYTLMTADWNGGPQSTPRVRNAVTQRYPSVYAGDTNSLTTSTKLHLHYGETAQADLHLHLATFYPVTMPVANAATVQFFNARITDADPFTGNMLNYNQRTGVIEGVLPNGHYTLLLNGGGPQQQAFALVPITVADAPLRTAPVALSPAGTIVVHVQTQFTSTQSNPSRVTVNSRGSGLANRQDSGQAQQQPVLQLLLRSENQRAGNGGAYTQPGPTPDELVLPNIQPGTYVVRPQMFRGYAASVTSDGVDLLLHPLVVNPGSAPPSIDVVVRDDTATLRGSVTSDTSAFPSQCLVALIPTDPAAMYTTARLDISGSKAEFAAFNVVPGSYRVIAIPNLRQQLAYRDPEFMRRFDGKGVTVTLSAGQQARADLQLLDAADAEDR